MATLKFTLKLKNRMEDLEKLNRALEILSVRQGMSKKCTCETNLVLEELFTNILRHGCCEQNNHQINITISVTSDMLTVQIEDDGVPFNPITAQAPNLKIPIEKREVGGLGIFLAKHYTEEIQYKRRGKKNILILKKKITPRPDEERVNGNH